MQERGPSSYAAEFLGTALLVMFIGFILTIQSGVEGVALGYREFAVVGLVHVFVLAFLIHAYGGVSGAHFNPAVTVALTALKKVRPVDAVIYILVQLSGAIVGALIVKGLLDVPGEVNAYGATLLNDGLVDSGFKGMVVEAIGTFALVTAIMATAVNPKGDATWAGWIIGGTLGMAVMCLGPMTGAGFNPARSFGPALVSGEWGSFGDWVLPYVAGPVLGALVAAFAYKFIAMGDASRRPVDSLDEKTTTTTE